MKRIVTATATSSTRDIHAFGGPVSNPRPILDSSAPTTTATPSPTPALGEPFAGQTLAIRPWPDQIVDTLGQDPRSTYVEQFWLGVLGPSTTWLLRYLAAGLEGNPAGFELRLEEAARQLGLGMRGGRHSPFMRAFDRLVQFDLARRSAADVLQVRRKVPPLNRRQLARLSEELKAAHTEWQEALHRTPRVEQMRRRSRQLALSLLELGEDLDSVERQLMRWQYHPAMCREAAAWAWDRHRAALAAADAGPELDRFTI